jgi:hypothetical protein
VARPEGPGDRAADAPAGPGHDDDPGVRSAHARLTFSGRRVISASRPAGTPAASS